MTDPRFSEVEASHMDDARAAAATTTSTQLLCALREEGNQTAWRDYTDRYRPMLLRYARRVGIDADAAEDVAQQTLVAFSAAYRAGKYERESGRLRDWLFGIARNEIRTWRRRQRRDRTTGGNGEELADLPNVHEDEFSALWEAEWRGAVLQHCLDLMREEVEPITLRAFELFALQGHSAREVAGELGLSENAVYGAKRRVLRRLREFMTEVEREF